MTSSNDHCWNEHLSSFSSYDGGTLTSSFAEAKRNRLSYERWLFKKIDENKAKGEDNSWLYSEVERLQSPDDTLLSKWNSRESLAPLEFGEIEDLPNWEDCGWSIKDADESIQMDGIWERDTEECSLSRLEVKKFETLKEAKKYADGIRKTFRSGRHDKEVVKTEIVKTEKSPYHVHVLESEPNWDHLRTKASQQRERVEKALSLVEQCTSRKELDRLAKAARQYSSNQILLQKGTTWDPRKKIHVKDGLTYKRFVMVMNSIYDRATELGLRGFKHYELKEWS
jgi:hypothetical protein